MKKLLAMLLAGLLVCAGCSQEKQQDAQDPDGPVANGAGQFGYITALTEGDDGYTLAFDAAEWLTATEGADRLRDLDIDPDTLDDGYYINNPDDDTIELVLGDEAQITVLSFSDWSEVEMASVGDFVEYYNTYLQDVQLPFWLTVDDGTVTEIRMQYLP